MHSASQTFVNHLNKIYPTRNKDNDIVTLDKVIFHNDLDGKSSTTKDLIHQIILLAKSGEDNGCIKSVSFDGKIASSEYKNKFWSWEDYQNSELIEIIFDENIDIKFFNIPLFKIDKRKKKSRPDFPGIKSLQYKRKNKNVKAMQTLLNKKGFYISEDEFGYYGKETCEAVKLYYRRYLGINSGTIVKDGKRFGPRGWERLFD